ncbi:MAG: UvrD-helicase domain-containing protein [Kineosporiaceae bacterium]|nr:UvrD-helicase domain-containing protein [Kineosporiaceae bacterium]
MTDDFPYSDAQRALVETPGSLFVEACPGAGKTRAIVGRFLRRVHEEPRKGVALLSFTNAAVDEAKPGRAGRGRDPVAALHRYLRQLHQPHDRRPHLHDKEPGASAVHRLVGIGGRRGHPP